MNDSFNLILIICEQGLAHYCVLQRSGTSQHDRNFNVM